MLPEEIEARLYHVLGYEFGYLQISKQIHKIVSILLALDYALRESLDSGENFSLCFHHCNRHHYVPILVPPVQNKTNYVISKHHVGAR